jgi:hypothetical protein
MYVCQEAVVSHTCKTRMHGVFDGKTQFNEVMLRVFKSSVIGIVR